MNSPYIMECPNLKDYEFVIRYIQLIIFDLSDNELDHIERLIMLENERRKSEGQQK